jgi:hypothetical protein
MGSRAVYERRHIVGGVGDNGLWRYRRESQLKSRYGPDGREDGRC